ncbi:MAG: hypothetical protein IKI57_01805 [Clostridia bacterium]|nr:hypothetical protein [Clostridia bacterium]
MASLIMHLVVSDIIKKKFALSDKYLLGSVLPDVFDKVNMTRKESHYLDCKGPETPNITKFIEANKNRLKDEVTLGYLSHLIEDKVWYNSFITRYIKELMIDQQEVIYIKDNSVHPIEDFWNTMYKDYDQIDRYLCEKYKINIEEYQLRISNFLDDPELKNKLDEILYLREIDSKREMEFVTQKDIKQYIDMATMEVNAILNKYID